MRPPRFGYSLEVILLICWAFALPMFQAPKNILWFAWVVVWLASRIRDGDWGGPWNGWDTLILAWVGSVLLAAVFAGTSHGEWKGCRDVARYTSVLWLLSRSNYPELVWKLVYRTLIVSVTVATIWALVALDWPHDYLGIELNAVGHVNDSLIYIVICFGALIAALANYWRSLPNLWRACGVGAVAILLIAVGYAGSRAAAVTVMVQAVALGVLWLRRSNFLLRCAMVSVIGFTCLIIGLDTQMWRKQEAISKTANPVLGPRYQIWNQALVGWRMHPVFGVGNTNFSQLRENDVAKWLVAHGEPYSDEMYAESSHAHSLYLNILAERGLVGILALAALLGSFMASLARGLPRARDPPLHWLLWCGAASALLTTAGIGVVNTTLHSETGLLAMLLIGAWIGYRRRSCAAANAAAGSAAIAASKNIDTAGRMPL